MCARNFILFKCFSSVLSPVWRFDAAKAKNTVWRLLCVIRLWSQIIISFESKCSTNSRRKLLNVMPSSSRSHKRKCNYWHAQVNCRNGCTDDDESTYVTRNVSIQLLLAIACEILIPSKSFVPFSLKPNGECVYVCVCDSHNFIVSNCIERNSFVNLFSFFNALFHRMTNMCAWNVSSGLRASIDNSLSIGINRFQFDNKRSNSDIRISSWNVSWFSMKRTSSSSTQS